MNKWEHPMTLGEIADDEARKQERQPMHGWICPKCGSVYALWVAKCSVCGPKITTSDTTNWSKP